MTSQSCGFAKPDPRILHVALDAMRVAPRHAVYVGDDPATDGAAARGPRASGSSGWTTGARERPAPRTARACLSELAVLL